MKIAVATNNGENVTGHLGRCRSFLVYTIENEEIKERELRTNTFTHHGSGEHQHGKHEHGAGEHRGHSHGALVQGLNDCKAVIFQSGGWRVINDLERANIKPVLTDESFADSAVEKYIAGTLEEKPDNTCRAH